MPPPSKSSIMTASGRYFDPLNPTPESVHMEDVARGLRGVRFNSQVRDPRDCPDPRSIASHSMRVARLVWWKTNPVVNRDGVSVQVASTIVLGALIHDAPEGYTQDRVRPLKTDRDREVEASVMTSIATSLMGASMAVDLIGAIGAPVIRWADDVALAQEAMLFQCGAEDWADASRMNVAETLHLFWPREGEDWLAAVRCLVAAIKWPVDDWTKVGLAIGVGVC